MLERRTLPFLLALGIAGPAFAAGVSIDRTLPRGYAVPGFDGTPVSIESAVENKTVTAWSYRSGRETDLAVAILDASGTWSEPVLLGRADGLDQVQPSLAIDLAGNVYLAMTTLPSREIWLSVLPAGGAAWTAPVAVTVAGERASSPTVRVVADRLVIAYRSRSSVVVRDLPLYAPVGSDGVQDGPDILPPSADSGDDGSGDDGGSDSTDDSASGGVRPKKP
jgi:hypothetical protein